jgi:hypothetical protein
VALTTLEAGVEVETGVEKESNQPVNQTTTTKLTTITATITTVLEERVLLVADEEVEEDVVELTAPTTTLTQTNRHQSRG